MARKTDTEEKKPVRRSTRTPVVAPRTRRVRRDEDRNITVKVARTGGAVVEVALNGNKTVEDALVAANVDFSARDRIRVNGDNASLDDILSQDDIVTISGKVQGGR